MQMLVHFLQKIQCFSYFFRFFVFIRFVTEQLVSEDPPKQFKREFIWLFVRKFRVVSFCFCFLRNSSVCFGCFDIGSKHRNKLNFFVFGFKKQTRNRSCFGLFRFEPKIIFVCFEDTLALADPCPSFDKAFMDSTVTTFLGILFFT